MIFVLQVLIHAGETILHAAKNDLDDRAMLLLTWTLEYLGNENVDQIVERDGGWVSRLYVLYSPGQSA